MKYPQTLQRKLPLMMSGIFIVAFATILGAAYASLTRAARAGAETSLTRATLQLARLGENAISAAAVRYRGVANDSSVQAALRNAASGQRSSTRVASGDAAAAAALARLRAATDSGLPIELWSATGNRVAYVGDDRLKLASASGDQRTGEPSFAGLDNIAPIDSLQLGRLVASDGRMRFWTVLPVLNSGTVVGYVAKQSGIAANPETERSLRELAGHTIYSFYKNADGSGWTTLLGRAAGPPARDSKNPSIYTRPQIGEVISDEERIAGTPFEVVMEAPVAEVLADPQRIVRSLALLSLVLFAIGITATWAIARRITNPLRNITLAAATIARGDYETRVPPEGDAELVRLAESFNKMVKEISDSHAALEKQTNVAKAASRAKTDFLATMSHELRTPLNAIGGYVELIEMELRGPVNETQRRDLYRIRAAQQHVLGLISSMLDLSRIEAGRVSYDLQPVALDGFLAGLDGLVAPQAATKSFALDYIPTDPTLGALADREKLRQIVLNLLSNAIRHTPSGGRITLDAMALDEDHVAIRVRDTGPGVPESKHDTIFEPFVQLDRSLAHPREGVGLGLAISRDLARGMGGDLTVENERPTGACFTLRLRRASVTEAVAGMAFTGEMPVGLRRGDAAPNGERSA